MRRLYLLTCFSVALALGIFLLKKRSPTTVPAGKGLVVPVQWLAVNDHPLTPKSELRTADQSFLTYPEWFLVFSPEEQAAAFKQHTATRFPFMSHTAQIWESYQIVNDQIKDHFPVNTGYHFMIWVIGSSASVEYTIKAWYELIIGRITDTRTPLTAEDQFNARFTQDYVDFIKDHPWYEFDFRSQLKTLWSQTPFWGSYFARKMERRYILSSELLVKYAYGKLIGLGTQQVYEPALPTTAVILSNDSLIYLPRYDKFAAAATQWAGKGYSFKEIAGNNGAILLTALIPADKELKPKQTKLIFTQPLASGPQTKRVALVTPVVSLDQVLLELAAAGITPEHVFDY